MLQPAASYPWGARSAINMRLVEISGATQQRSKPEETLVMLLNFLLNKSDGKIAKMPTAALLGLMHNAGIGNSYEELDNMITRSSSAKNLIKNLDRKQVTIGKASDPSDIDYPAGDQTDVTKMATRAATKAID